MQVESNSVSASAPCDLLACQLSVISYELSISCQLSVTFCQLSVNFCQWSVTFCQLSIVSCQLLFKDYIFHIISYNFNPVSIKML